MLQNLFTVEGKQSLSLVASPMAPLILPYWHIEPQLITVAQHHNKTPTAMSISCISLSILVPVYSNVSAMSIDKNNIHLEYIHWYINPVFSARLLVNKLPQVQPLHCSADSRISATPCRDPRHKFATFNKCPLFHTCTLHYQLTLLLTVSASSFSLLRSRSSTALFAFLLVQRVMKQKRFRG